MKYDEHKKQQKVNSVRKHVKFLKLLCNLPLIIDLQTRSYKNVRFN